MKKNSIISVISGVLIASLLTLMISSCTQSVPTLNATLPSGSFTYQVLTPTGYANPQNLQLISSTQNGMQSYWTIPGVGTFTGDTASIIVPFAGTYVVKLNVGGPGGLSDTIQQSIVIPKDNLYALDPNGLQGILVGANTGVTKRTWMANRVNYACVVYNNFQNVLTSIDNGGSGAWWGYGAAELNPVTGRNGYLDDTYTFEFAAGSPFVYNDNNTVYLDQGGSGWTKALPAPWNSYGGTTSSTDLYNLVPALKPWGSGSFSYTITPAPAGAMKLGQIKVNGVGAHFGLQDKVNGAEVSSPTGISSITYEVLRISTNLVDATGKHYDELIIGLTYDGNGDVWAFRFRADR